LYAELLSCNWSGQRDTGTYGQNGQTDKRTTGQVKRPRIHMWQGVGNVCPASFCLSTPFGLFQSIFGQIKKHFTIVCCILGEWAEVGFCVFVSSGGLPRSEWPKMFTLCLGQSRGSLAVFPVHCFLESSSRGGNFNYFPSHLPKSLPFLLASSSYSPIFL